MRSKKSLNFEVVQLLSFIYMCLLVCTLGHLCLYLSIRYLFLYVNLESANKTCNMTSFFLASVGGTCMHESVKNAGKCSK